MSVSIKVFGLLFAISCLFLPTKLWATEVMPENIDVSLRPGQATEVVFEVFNDQLEEKNYEVRLLTVESVEDGLQFSEIQTIQEVGLKISPINFSVEPQNIQAVTLTVAAGEEVQTGSAIIGVQVTELSDSIEGVGVQTGIVALAFLTFGDVNGQELKIVSFDTRSKFASQLPVELTLELENISSAIIQPIGVIEVKNVFGKTVQILDINPHENRVLPNSDRILLISWGNMAPQNGFFEKLQAEFARPRFGQYTFELKLRVNDASELLEDKVRVIIFPWRFCLVLLLSVGLVLGGLRFIQWSRKHI